MSKPNTCDLTILLDCSGSMNKIKTDMEESLNAFLAAQAKEPGECTVSLVNFAYRRSTVYTGVPVAEAPKVRLTPLGGTALNDALCETIDEVGQRLAALPEADRPERVLLVVVTDGEENASREYTLANVKQ